MKYVNKIPSGWVTLAELADLRDVTYQTATRWVDAGLPVTTYKIVGQKPTRYVKLSDVKRWLRHAR